MPYNYRYAVGAAEVIYHFAVYDLDRSLKITVGTGRRAG